MAATVGSILVGLDVDNGRLDRALTQSGRRFESFQRTTNQHLARVDSRWTRTSSGIIIGANRAGAALGGLAKGALLAAVPILSVGAAIAKAREGLEDFDVLAKRIRFAGFSDTSFYQGAQHLFDLGGIGKETTAKALENFNRGMGQAAEGTGRLASQLKILDAELLRALQSAGSQEERLRIIADRLKAIEDPSKRAAIAVAIFGSEGAKMADVLKAGAAELDKATAAAKAMGLTIEADVLANAETMNDRLSVASQVIDVKLKKALIDIVPFLVSAAEFAAGLADGVRWIGDSVNYLAGNIASMTSAGLEQKLRDLGAERVRVENEIIKLRREGADGSGWGPNLVALEEARLAEILEEEKRILDALNNRPTLTPSPVFEPTEFGGGTGAGRNESAKAAIKEADAVAKVIEALEHEKAMLGLSAEQQRVVNALRQAGGAATLEQQQQIVALVTAIESERAALERNRAIINELRELATSFGQDFRAALGEGKSAWEAFATAGVNALDRISSKLMDMAVNGLFDMLLGAFTGGIGGGMGFSPQLGRGLTGPSVFGGGNGFFLGSFADGGAGRIPGTGAADSAWALARVTPGEPFAFGAAAMQGIAAGGVSAEPQRVHVTVGLAVDASGNIRPYVEKIADDRVSRFSRHELPGRVSKIQSNPGVM